MSPLRGVRLARKHSPNPTKTRIPQKGDSAFVVISTFAVAVSRQVKKKKTTEYRAPHGSTSTCWKQAPRIPESRSTEQTEVGIVKSPRMPGGVGVEAPLERCSVGTFRNSVSLQDLASAENRTASVPENSRSRACPHRCE